MPRKKQTPRNVEPLLEPQPPNETVLDWLRRSALQRTWADVCTIIFAEWYGIWKQHSHSQDLNWDQFHRQVEKGARQFWLSDPMRNGRDGRPREAEQCWEALEAYTSRLPVSYSEDYPDPTQGELMRAIQLRCPKVAKSTRRKYARHWQLLRKSPQEYTKGDWKFLDQLFPEDAVPRRLDWLSSKDKAEALKEVVQDLAKNNLLR